MTRTEERLADALGASAGQVRDDRLRPLTELEPEPGPGTHQGGRARAARRGWLARGLAPETRVAWRGWLAPAAAAVSVVLIIGLALAVTGGRHGGRGGPATGTAPLPRYFAQFASTDQVGGKVEIRSVATGAVIASAPSPHRPGWSLQDAAMAAAPDGRTFYVAYTAEPSGISPLPQTWIYRFSTTDSSLTMVKGGVIPRDIVIGRSGDMAVSPDGRKLALTVAMPAHGFSAPGEMGKIIAVDLRTGARTSWEGGLDRSGRTLLIADVSWAPDGRSIVFLALWCHLGIGLNLCAEALDLTTYRLEQVRSVPVASNGGSLSRGTNLLVPGGTLPVIAAAVAGPRPGELTLVVLSGRSTPAGSWPVVAVERVAARTGSVLGTEYRRVTKPGGRLMSVIEFAADPSGQHLLLAYDSGGGWRTGWISQGKFHPLPIRQPYPGFPVTAW